MTTTASSALVNVVDGSELCLVRLLADSAAPGSIRPNFIPDCEANIAHSDATQLLKTIVAEQGAIAALVSLEEEAVSAISLLAACLDQVEDTDSEKMLNELADSIISIATSADNADSTAKAISLLALRISFARSFIYLMKSSFFFSDRSSWSFCLLERSSLAPRSVLWRFRRS